LEVRILNGLRVSFSQVQILKQLGAAIGELTADSLQLTAVEERKR
jgi:Trp operon repressor